MEPVTWQHDFATCDVCAPRLTQAAKRGRAAAARAMRAVVHAVERSDDHQLDLLEELINGPVEVAGFYRRTGLPDDGGAYLLAGDETIRRMKL